MVLDVVDAVLQVSEALCQVHLKDKDKVRFMSQSATAAEAQLVKRSGLRSLIRGAIELTFV